MTNKKIVTPIVFKVLTTMKEEEHSTVAVRPDCVKELDPDGLFTKTQDKDCTWDENAPLMMNFRVFKLNKVEDLYKDQQVFYKTIRYGEGTGQPYQDSRVVLKVSIEIDGQLAFAHKEPLSIELKQSSDEERKHLELNNEYYAYYDLEEYTLPALIRKLLKTTKRH